MKTTLKRLIACLLLAFIISTASAAISINSFSIGANYLNSSGQIKASSTTTTNITYSFSLTRGFDYNTNQYENTISYVRLVYKNGTTNVVSAIPSDITIQPNMYTSNIYNTTGATAVIPALLSNGTVSLECYYWDQNNLLWTLQSITTYQIVNTGSGGPTNPPQSGPPLDAFFTNGAGSFNYRESDPQYPDNTPSPGTKITVSDVIPILTIGQSIYSPNNLVRITLQTDGNMVIYKKANATSAETPVWSSGTMNQPATKVFFQTDGNLVIYGGSTNGPLSPGYSPWSSGKYNNSGLNTVSHAYYLLQNDGNFVFYFPTYHQTLGPVWVIRAASDSAYGPSSHSPTLNHPISADPVAIVSVLRGTHW